jgi:hypothetical protein
MRTQAFRARQINGRINIEQLAATRVQAMESAALDISGGLDG